MRSIIFLLLLGCLCKAQRVFPDEFRFGVATASYQIEGAWDVSDKGENIWDYLTHNTPDKIDDSSNGDVACDAYHKTAEDVQLLVDLGVDFYRFSISWSRLLPTGHANYVSEDGVRYYNELIDTLIENDITPLVTMFHWDLPQPLQEIGGWPSPVLVDLFVDYADVLFENFGDRVKEWITFNEPYQICQQGYGEGTKAPAYTQDGIGGYLCGHTLLLAHAYTYRRYQEKYLTDQEGKVGITVNGNWADPESVDSTDDALAAEAYVQFNFGWFLHPIFSDEGNYPAVMIENIEIRSGEEGFSISRLPEFTPEEITLLKGSADFLGLNHYTSFVCTSLDLTDSDVSRPSLVADMGADCYQPPDWEGGASTWLKVRPQGLRDMLFWIKENYNNPEVMVTENGYSDAGDFGDLNDCNRVNYYNTYLEALLEAVIDDECDVTAYTAWSFMDNFEWMRGYTERFGLYYVDFEDDDRPRTPKKSSYVYSNIIRTRAIDAEYDPVDFLPCSADSEET